MPQSVHHQSPLMPSMPPELPVACLHNGDQWLLGQQPVQRLVASSAQELASLPARLAETLGGRRVAIGVIRYPSDDTASLPGNVAEVCVFEQIRRQPTLADYPAHSPAFCLASEFSSDLPHSDYLHAIARIHHYLRAGDCYQVNFARRFSARFSGDPFSAWLRLNQQHPAPHSSFFRLANGDCVFGVSPERFLQIRNGVVITEPIKGSRQRGDTPQQDQQIGEELLNNPKDRAENLMIVDLLRNDLGKVCQAGSVKAEPLFELRRFSNVQHLVSTITGQLLAQVHPLDALLSCFPGGSITGAPKKRAMEIINELEPVPRGFYCGSQFVLDSDGNLDSNILIRTFQTHGEQIICHGGGGIVIDSDAEQEYQESLFKVEKLMAALL